VANDELKPHPLADMIPDMSEDEYNDLVGDIKNTGKLRERIVLLEGMILDGRHRYRALLELGMSLEGKTRNFDPAREGNPADFVISRNIILRHLSKAQRVAVLLNILGSKAPKRPQSEVFHPTDVPVGGKIKAAKLATFSGAALRTIRRVRAIQRECPEAIPQIASGNMSVTQVEKELGHRAQKKMPTLEELKRKAFGNECGAVWMRYNGVILAVAASTEAQEEFSSSHSWPCVYSDD
jgi:hypothetical protein